jgi:hypothetical protein
VSRLERLVKRVAAERWALWAAGDYVPMLYSTQAIEAAAEYRIQLVPAAGAASRSAPDSASAEKTP